MKRNAGYTFLEMLIAMTILIIGIVAIMRMLPIALREAHLAGEKSVAAQFADSQLGMARSVGAETLMMNPVSTASPGRILISEIVRGIQLDQNLTPDERAFAAAATSYSMYTGWQADYDRQRGAGEVFLQRVVFSVEMPDGRRESFLTYVTRQ